MSVNDTLLSLNLNNTSLDAVCSRKLREMMEFNGTIVRYRQSYPAWTSTTTPI